MTAIAMSNPSNPNTATVAIPGEVKRESWDVFAFFASIILFVAFFAFEQDLRTSTYVDFVAETDVREEWTEGGNRSRQLGAFALAGFGMICLLLKSPRQLRLCDSLTIVAGVYVSYILASYWWSIDPDLTRRRLLVLAFFGIAVMGMAKRFSPQVIAEITMVMMTAYLLTGVATELSLGTFRPWSGEHRFAGTTHPNSQAGYMVILCLSAWCVSQRPGPFRALAIPIMVAGFMFLLLTRSRTSLAGFVLAFTVANTIASDKWKYFRVVFALSWLVVMGLILLLLAGFDPTQMGSELFNMGRRDTTTEEAGSLTGRLPLWELMWDYIDQSPWWGHGYAAFWTNEHFMEVANEIEWAPANSHSSYIECLLDLGIFGLIIMVIGLIVILFRLALRCANKMDPACTFAFAIFLYALTFSVTEASLLSPSMITFLLACSVASQLIFQPKVVKIPVASH